MIKSNINNFHSEAKPGKLPVATLLVSAKGAFFAAVWSGEWDPQDNLVIWLLLLSALLVGAVLPLQAGINAQLRHGLGHPILAALASISAGTMFLLIFTVALRPPFPPFSTLSNLPWWSWLGGFLGAFYLAASLTLAPKLGAASLIAALVAGQMLASVLLDHYGLVGYKVRPVHLCQLLGIGLVIAGVILIQRK